jgi:hypothetical protein
MTKREDKLGEYSLDELAMGVADGTLSRSRALKALFAAVLSGVFSIFALPSRNADAAMTRQLTTLWAVVDADGNLVRGKGAVKSERLGTGFYRVTFNRNVRACAYIASVGWIFSGEIGASGPVPATQTPLLKTQVFVQTRSSGAMAANIPFHLLVKC